MGDTDADNSFLSQPVINYPGIKGTEIAFETIKTKQKKLLPGKTQKRDNKKPCFDPVLLYFVLKEALSTNHHFKLS